MGSTLFFDHAWLATGVQADWPVHPNFLTPLLFFYFISLYLAGAESKSWYFLAERQSETAVTLEILFTFLPPDTHSITSAGHAWWLLFIQLAVLSAPPIDGEAERGCLKPRLLVHLLNIHVHQLSVRYWEQIRYPTLKDYNRLLREDRNANIHQYTRRVSVGRGRNGVTWEHRKEKD